MKYLLPIFLLFVGCSNVVSSEADNSIPWDCSQLPLQLVLEDNYPPLLTEALLKATDRWNRAVGHPVVEVPAEGLLEPTKGIVDVGTDPAEGTVGYAGLYYDKDTVRGYLDMTLQSEPVEVSPGIWESVSPTNLEQVATHEIGHVLGFGHEDSSISIMHPSASGDITEKHIKAVRCSR